MFWNEGVTGLKCVCSCYCNRSLDSTVRSSHMGAFIEQLQNEQTDKVREKASGLHLYSNDVAM